MDQEEPMQEEIVLLKYRVQHLHGRQLGNARIRRRLHCVVFSFALMGHLVACSMQADLSKGARERLQETVGKHGESLTNHSTQVDKAREFEGHWSYRNDCDRGHYVTLDIKRDNDLLIGSWSDGTLLRGSQGLLKGRISKGRLIAKWCSEYEEAGAPALCPHYDRSEDYLEARDGSIVWHQKYGQEYSEYVVLTKGSKPLRSTEACDAENQGAS